MAVTNLRHRTVSMKDDTVRRFLTLVDGTRTLDELVTDLNAAIGANRRRTRAACRARPWRKISACWRSSACWSPEVVHAMRSAADRA